VARAPIDVKQLAAVASIVLVAAAASPVLRDPADDSFPLSTYPMFAHERERTFTVAYPIGRTGEGARRVLEPRFVGTTEVLQALTVVDDALASGDGDALCARIARAVGRDRVYRDVVAIELVVGTHDAVDYLVRGRVGAESVRTRCGVAR
jgi:hypothetical protein